MMLRTQTSSGSLILATALLSFTLSACSKPSPDDAAGATEANATAVTQSGRTIRVQTETVQLTTFTETVSVTGSVEAIDDAVLSARSSGTVVSLVPLGRNVLKGATIASIDAGLAEATVQQAEASRNAAMAQHALAEDTFNRQQPLFRDSVISPIEFQQVKAQLSSSKAQLDAAEATLRQVQEQLAYTKVTAPFSGSVEAHMVELGEQVAPGSVVARLVNTSRVRVAAGIPERYAGDIQKGAETVVDLQSYGLEPRDGKVTFVGSAIDAGNRTFPVEIELYNSKGSLKPEMIATVIVTRKKIDNALVIKQSSVLRDEFGSSVYVVDRSSGEPTAQRLTIQIGPSNRGMVVVTDGITAGAELITVGQSNVAPGDLLEIESRPAAQATL